MWTNFLPGYDAWKTMSRYDEEEFLEREEERERKREAKADQDNDREKTGD